MLEVDVHVLHFYCTAWFSAAGKGMTHPRRSISPPTPRQSKQTQAGQANLGPSMPGVLARIQARGTQGEEGFELNHRDLHGGLLSTGPVNDKAAL